MIYSTLRTRPATWFLAGLAAVLGIGFVVGNARTADKPASPPILFNRDIRPILSDNCFACHGPDPANRKAGLRLDQEQGLFGKRDGGTPVVRGKPAESELFARIITDNKREQMPPEKSHKKLTAAQKDLLKRWIEQGATWEPHWSLVAAKRPATPQVAKGAWVRNPIDAFILARLEAAGLTPAPEADRATLVRRLSFDLRGLPPSVEELQEVLNDKSQDWYERYVDRLLASKHFGEHRARYWLDAARFADTHGLHFDNYREMWPYRDWVIDAFNKNVPFDKFTIFQLAGDLMTPAPGLPGKLELQIASGFHRCNITTNEGGVIQAEVDAMYARDRVETTATVWLGLTAGCANCHDHKFDPISQKEFYSFVAFFKNTTQPIMDGNIPNTPPIVVVPRAEDRDRWFALEKDVAQLQAQRDARMKEAQAASLQWLSSGGAKKLTEPLEAKDLHLGFSLTEGDDDFVFGTIKGEEHALMLTSGLTWGAGPTAADKAIHLAPKAFLEIPDGGDFEANQPFTVGAWVFLPATEDSYTVLSKKDGKGRGWELEIASRIPGFKLTGDSDKDRIEIRGPGSNRLQPGKWSHVLVSYDGSRKASGLSLYVNGKPEAPQRPQDPTLKGNIRNDGTLRIGFDGKRDFKGGAIHDLRIYGRSLRPEEAALVARWDSTQRLFVKDVKALTPPEKQDLLSLYIQRIDTGYHPIIAKLAAVEKEQAAIKARSAITHVMQEKPGTMPKANVLFRGQYDQPRDEVTPATPSALHPLKAHGSQSVGLNRLNLAQWLMDPANPLTARVTVNRFWQEAFGTGLVRTSEDFGIMGENPSHPELLDWLAVEFRESGWNIKHIYRLLVTSATYRQAALTTPEKLKADPNNRLLSRGPRFRHDAETLRDFALAASGLLVDKIGGPSVKPYQPPGIWEAVAMHVSNTRFYKADQGEGLYRRSLYKFWKRAAPPASMDIFNAPSRENCTVRRERTNTPLQALVTMNDPQFVEAARHLAQRAILEAPDDFNRRLDFVTLRLLSRPFDDKEREICKAALEQFRSRYTANPQAADKLIRTGESKPDAKVPAVDLAAWTMLASQVMNLDEALNK
jgi:hypothetical protein